MGHIEQICRKLIVILCTIFKILLINFFYNQKRCISDVPQMWLKSQKSTLIVCTIG